MASNTVMIRKLQNALNRKGCKLLYSSSQFYSEEADRPITVYHIKQSVYDEEKGKNINIELFKSTSQIQIVLFLRDMWYEVNGWKVPNDNETWNEKKKSLAEKSNKTT